MGAARGQRGVPVPRLRGPRGRDLPDGSGMGRRGQAATAQPTRPVRPRLLVARGHRPCRARGLAVRHPGLPPRAGSACLGQRRAPSRWAPSNPADFADFLTAASRRYPGVHHWMIWGEPTKAAELPAAGRRPRTATAGRAAARPAPVRAHARRGLRRAQARQPPQPRDRRQQLHRRDGLASALDRGAASAERQAAADGPLRPQPVLGPPAGPLTGHARPGLRRLLGPRLAVALDRPEPAAEPRAASRYGSSSPSSPCRPITPTSSSTST